MISEETVQSLAAKVHKKELSQTEEKK
jgi:hypothetical protein